jgi:hypothetical protein
LVRVGVVLLNGYITDQIHAGGTNTDAVVAARREQADDHGKSSAQDIDIIASGKSQTTADITTGIQSAIQNVLATTQIPRANVISVNIGTTHFINAVVQSDKSSLSRVAVIRLCGPFCREVAPFTGFPASLRNVVEGYVAYVDGGLESMTCPSISLPCVTC